MYIDLQEYQEFSKPAFTREGLIVQFPRRVTGITRDGSRILLHLQAMVCRKEPVVISALMQGRTFRFTGQWAPTVPTPPCAVDCCSPAVVISGKSLTGRRKS